MTGTQPGGPGGPGGGGWKGLPADEVKPSRRGSGVQPAGSHRQRSCWPAGGRTIMAIVDFAVDREQTAPAAWGWAMDGMCLDPQH